MPLAKGAGKELCPINVHCWTPAQGPATPRAPQPLSCAPHIMQDVKVKKKGKPRVLLLICSSMMGWERDRPRGHLVFQPRSTVRGRVNHSPGCCIWCGRGSSWPRWSHTGSTRSCPQPLGRRGRGSRTSHSSLAGGETQRQVRLCPPARHHQHQGRNWEDQATWL